MKRLETLDEREKQARQSQKVGNNATVAISPKLIGLIVAVVACVILMFFALFGKKQPDSKQVSTNSNSGLPYSISAVEIDGKKYEVDSEEDILGLLFSSGEAALEDGAFEILKKESEHIVSEYSNRVEYSFTIKNNTEYSLSSISIFGVVLDKDDNIVGDTSASLHATLSAGKSAKIEGTIYDYDPDMAKIAIDYIYYDTNGDHVVEKYYFSEDEKPDTVIIIDP